MKRPDAMTEGNTTTTLAAVVSSQMMIKVLAIWDVKKIDRNPSHCREILAYWKLLLLRRPAVFCSMVSHAIYL